MYVCQIHISNKEESRRLGSGLYKLGIKLKVASHVKIVTEGD